MASGRAQSGTHASGARIGPWTVEGFLGEGAMGVVYRATDDSGRVVALKVIRAELAGDVTLLRRFEHEGRMVAAITNRHVVEVVAIGRSGGEHWIAFAFVSGGSLADRNEGAPLTVDEILGVAADVAAGLDALHSAGVVHRDVKPTNILMDETGRALVTDFGLAKGRDLTALTQIGDVLGTTDYMAPEVMRGEPATAAADVYSFGCVLFECIAGLPPFTGNPMSVAMSHLRSQPPDPCANRAGLPPALGFAVLRALAKEPAERPATATAVARMMSAAVSG